MRFLGIGACSKLTIYPIDRDVFIFIAFFSGSNTKQKGLPPSNKPKEFPWAYLSLVCTGPGFTNAAWWE
jgi:hypothetical protein